jgi:DNA-binding transcriptional MerR regulator
MPMDKASGAYRTISEVAEDLDIPQHVLRFWETRFPQIKPMKRSGGRRYYRPGDVLLLRGIRRLLYGEGYTIKGVQRILSAQGIGVVQQAGGASGEELALAAELDSAGAGAALEPNGDDGIETESFSEAEERFAASTAEPSQPPEVRVEVDRMVVASGPVPEASLRQALPPLSPERRRLLEKALEELRACARDLATLYVREPDQRSL